MVHVRVRMYRCTTVKHRARGRKSFKSILTHDHHHRTRASYVVHKVTCSGDYNTARTKNGRLCIAIFTRANRVNKYIGRYVGVCTFFAHTIGAPST